MLHVLSERTNEQITYSTIRITPQMQKNIEMNAKYIEGLLENLTESVDKWILNGSPIVKETAMNVLKQIELESMDVDLVQQAYRLMKRAGMPVDSYREAAAAAKQGGKELGKTDSEDRTNQADARKNWESFRTNVEEVGNRVGKTVPNMLNGGTGNSREPSGLDAFATQKKDLQATMNNKTSENKDPNSGDSDDTDIIDESSLLLAQAKSSELVACSGSQFDGETMGIGGLDDVLAQVKRRVWVPLAAPPQLLAELGISPVRGLLLYGKPGCGKTLIARTIGKILSPARPVTLVSGPEILDKFVGSSEKVSAFSLHLFWFFSLFVWFGLVWFGLVSFGLVSFGLVWSSVVVALPALSMFFSGCYSYLNGTF